jgi:hypothetical protein
MADPAAAVTLHVWRVPAADAAAAVVRSQLDLRRFRARADVAFAKMLGTASDAFLPSAVTPTRWAALVCWRAAPPAGTTPWWDEHATERAKLRLRPVHARGTWDGQMPFDATGRAGARDGHGVVVVTRSTLRLRKAAAFYRAVPPVATQLRATPGCRAAFGIGEAPLVRQGTVSIWESDDAVGGFLRSPAHRSAVAATPHQRWYAEELFARFAIEAAEGCLDGQVLG